MRARPDEADAPAASERRRTTLERAAEVVALAAPTDQDEAHSRHAGGHAREGFEQDVDALPGDQQPDVEDERLVGREPQTLARCAPLERLELRAVDTVRDQVRRPAGRADAREALEEVPFEPMTARQRRATRRAAARAKGS